MPISTTLSSPPLLLTHPHRCLSSLITIKHPTLQFKNHGNLRHGFDSLSLLKRNERFVGVWVEAKGDVLEEDEEEKELRSESTLPDRYRPLTKVVPVPPVRWPWFVVGGVAILLYAYSWRAVVWELKNWGNSLKFIAHSMGQLLNFIGSFIYYYLGDVIESSLSVVWSIYSGIVSSAPVPALTNLILLASVVLSIAEATVPDSVNSQPYLLTFSGIIGYGVVSGFISEPFFYTLLLGIFSFARFVKKRDYVSSALPVAAVVASVGEPWIRAVVLISFTALGIDHHRKHPVQGKERTENGTKTRKLPLPLVGVALAVAIRVTANWAGYRHLTWINV